MDQQEESKPVVVLEGDFVRASLVKNLLENNGIQVFIENQLMGSIAPFQLTAGGLSPVRVIVSSVDYEQSIRLIEEFNNEPH